ncbi:hypothetical protein ACFL6Y_07450 [Elusimicrobiota bacterium]
MYSIEHLNKGNQIRTIFFLSILGCALLSASFASAYQGAPAELQGHLDTLFSNAAFTHPLRDGRLELKIVPAYITDKGDTSSEASWSDIDGKGLGAAIAYGLSDHWGIGLFASGVKTDGRTTTFLSKNFENTYRVLGGPLQGDYRGSAMLVATTLIFDFKSGEGFRLPIFLGVGFERLSAEVDDIVLGFKREAKGNLPVGVVGIVPQFNVWKWRLAPFLIAAKPTKKPIVIETRYNPSTEVVLETANLKSAPDTTAASGIDVTYCPWNLGLVWVPEFTTEGVTGFFFKWAHGWGK